MRVSTSLVLGSMAFVVLALPTIAQVPAGKVDTEQVDMEMVAKIKDEALKRSQIMDTISYLTDIHGPRLTGSPITRRAGNWAVQQMTQWGLADAHLETWGPFGRGWTLEAFTANIAEPNYVPLIAFPKAWSPSTPKTIRGEPVYLDVEKTADFEKYRGKLHRAIVLISPPRDVTALFEPLANRKSDQELLELANADPQARRRSSSSSLTPGSTNSSSKPAVGEPKGAGDQPASTVKKAKPSEPSRSSTQLQADKWQFAYDEGAAVVLEPGRGDGGTVFLTAVTLPRKADAQRSTRDGQGENPFSRGPRPWIVAESEILPQVVVAVEQYNRLVRMLQKGEHPQLEIDIASRFHSDEPNSFNVIAEIPGTDLKHEVVMLGAHFDSWHSGTGATDNAAGCGVVLEAMRILKAIGAQPRRTVRVALWTGEEQGLLGSRAYVSEHFGTTTSPASDKTDKSDDKSSSDSKDDKPAVAQTVYELKPEHEKLSAYFNLDNGTGKIRGIYLQGNEAVRPIFREWLKPFAEMGAATISSANTGGTDHLSFDGIGLPGFQFIQDQLEYNTRTHHSNMDTWERVQADDVKQAAIVMATFAYQAAVRNDKLPRKNLEGEVKSKVAPATPVPAVNPAPAINAVPAAAATAR